MREISVNTITEAVAKLCIQANCVLNDDVYCALKNAKKTEKSEIGKEILCQLTENADIAKDETVPICQDTGMAVGFVEIGQEVHIAGGLLTDAVKRGRKKRLYRGLSEKNRCQRPVHKG